MWFTVKDSFLKPQSVKTLNKNTRNFVVSRVFIFRVINREEIISLYREAFD